MRMNIGLKKILSIFIVIAVVLSATLAFTSCDDDGFTDYFEHGLKYRLPDYFRKRNILGTEITYTTPGATFEVQVMPRTEIDSDNLEWDFNQKFDFTITVDEYAKLMIDENGWNCYPNYTYDEQRNVANFYFFWKPSEEMEYEYYYFSILKSNDALYVVLMTCAEEDYENYAPLFTEWAQYLEAVDA